MNSELLRASLIDHEGRKAKPYRDTVGKLTIGVGRNLDDVGLRAEEIDFMLTNDITAAWMAVTTTWPWVQNLSDVRQRVLTEMVFQMGVGGVGAFKHALQAMAIGNFEKAADEMLDSKWALTDSPGRAHLLAAMMRTDADP